MAGVNAIEYHLWFHWNCIVLVSLWLLLYFAVVVGYFVVVVCVVFAGVHWIIICLIFGLHVSVACCTFYILLWVALCVIFACVPVFVSASICIDSAWSPVFRVSLVRGYYMALLLAGSGRISHANLKCVEQNIWSVAVFQPASAADARRTNWVGPKNFLWSPQAEISGKFSRRGLRGEGKCGKNESQLIERRTQSTLNGAAGSWKIPQFAHHHPRSRRRRRLQNWIARGTLSYALHVCACLSVAILPSLFVFYHIFLCFLRPPLATTLWWRFLSTVRMRNDAIRMRNLTVCIQLFCIALLTLALCVFLFANLAKQVNASGEHEK